MRKAGGVFFGNGPPGRYSAPGANTYRPLKGFAQSLTIVVADDEPDSVTTLAMILRDEGHEVREVTKAKDVLVSVRIFKPDVVILDISMPDASGYEIAKEIRRQYAERSPLLIAITGVYRKETDKLLSEVVGFHHHLTKPCDPKELLALIAPLAYPDR